MVKKFACIFAIAIIWLFLLPTYVYAIYSPTSVANNKFGIHITDESDLQKATNLVNSSGGDWGYVTIVIRSDERDTRRWQAFFDKLRELHIMPIVRVASKITPDSWEKLNIDEIDGWVSFLNSLNWVAQNRYVIVGNEVNLGKEWGGRADPKEYSIYLSTFAHKLKAQSGDFFILPAGLDSSANNSVTDINENDFLIQMFNHNREVFNNIDGLASHSYPYNAPNTSSDRGTLKHYEWELSILKFLGVEKTLPVFITETGWMHGPEYMSEKEISSALTYAYNNVWNDEKIVAVTPFVLNYSEHPFDHYSWIGHGGKNYEFYETYKNLPKVTGTPIQLQSGEVISYLLPRFLITEFENIYGFMFIKNTGQAVWKGYEPISLILNEKSTTIKPITILSDVLPGETTLAVYTLK